MTFCLELVFLVSLFIILYANFGYLLVVWLWAKVRPRKVRKDANFTPSLSVIIPAYNVENTIAQTIENALSLEYPSDKMEVIVISDGSTDGTNEIIRRYNDSRLHYKVLEQNAGKSSALRAGVSMVSGEIIVLTDADSSIPKDSVKQLIAGFADPEVGAVVGRVIIANKLASGISAGASLHWKYQEALRKYESIAGSTVSAAGVFHALRRQLFPELPDNVPDDQYILLSVLARRYRVIGEQNAVATTHAPYGIAEEFRRKARIQSRQLKAVRCMGRRLFRMSFQDLFFFISHKGSRWLVPWCLIMVFASNMLLISKTLYFWLFLAQILIYVLSAVWFIFQTLGLRIPKLHLLFYFFVTNAALATGAVRWTLFGSPARWSVSQRKEI